MRGPHSTFGKKVRLHHAAPPTRETSARRVLHRICCRAVYCAVRFRDRLTMRTLSGKPHERPVAYTAPATARVASQLAASHSLLLHVPLCKELETECAPIGLQHLFPNKQGVSELLEVAPWSDVWRSTGRSICKRLLGGPRLCDHFQHRTCVCECLHTRLGQGASQSNNLSRPPYSNSEPSLSHVETLRRSDSVVLGPMTARWSRPPEKIRHCEQSPSTQPACCMLYRNGGPRAVPTCAWPCVST